LRSTEELISDLDTICADYMGRNNRRQTKNNRKKEYELANLRNSKNRTRYNKQQRRLYEKRKSMELVSERETRLLKQKKNREEGVIKNNNTNEYAREYRKNNRESVLEISRTFYKNHRERCIDKSSKFYQDNKEECNRKAREYRQRPEVKERLRLSKKKYRDNNKEKICEASKLYYSNNKELIKQRKQKWKHLQSMNQN